MTEDRERFDAALADAAAAALEGLRDAAPALVLAVLSSDDGFEAVRIPRDGDGDGRFAAIASSVQALAEAVVHELRIGMGRAIVIQASEGVVIQMRVARLPFVVSALFTAGEDPGECLAAVGDCSAALAVALADAPV